MEDTLLALDRDCSALAGLFQIIINDLKNGGTMWEDFINKTSKLHQALKTTLGTFSGFLDAFQKIADSATHARGATKDMGAVLTRLSMRHRAIETRIKNLTMTLTCCLVIPLQEKLDEWRRSQHSLDKDHTKEYRRMRSDIKKRTENALRLQKKAKKAGKNSELHKVLEGTLRDLTTRYGLLEETERTALRQALTEERSRYCTFALALKPVLEEEIGLVRELSHVEEVMEQLEKHSSDPSSLPPSSEQVVEDVKNGEALWAWRTPPSSPASCSSPSPTSLGSRKSSFCSISSLNSSSSSSAHSPSHHVATTTAAASASSSPRARSASGLSEPSSWDGTRTSPAAPTTWPNLTNAPAADISSSLYQKSASTTGLHTLTDRPHTISSAYERGRDRPPLTVYTFQPPKRSDAASPRVSSQPVSPVCYEVVENMSGNVSLTATISRRSSRTSLHHSLSSSSQESLHSKPRPPIPLRCSSLERPSIPDKPNLKKSQQKLIQHFQLREEQNEDPPLQNYESQNVEVLTTTMPDFHKAAPDMVVPQPMYSNMSELRENLEEVKIDDSSAHENRYGSQPNVSLDHISRLENVDASKYCMLRPHSLAFSPHTFNFSSQVFNTKGFTIRQSGSLRRSQKPPPPIRRTPSITCASSLASSSFPCSEVGKTFTSDSNVNSSVLFSPVSGKNSSGQSSSNESSSNASPLQKTDSESSTPVGSLENLPPPPAFLLEESHLVDEGKESTELKGISLSSESNFKCADRNELREKEIKRISVSETIKSLQNSHHQPPSPITHRRSQSFRMHIPPPQSKESIALEEERKLSLDGPRAALISSLNAKLAISNPGFNSLPRQQTPLQSQQRKGSPKVSKSTLRSVQEGIDSGNNNTDCFQKGEVLTFKKKTFPVQFQPIFSSNSTAASNSPNYSPILKKGEKAEGKASVKLQQDSFIHNLNMVLAQRSSTPEQFSHAASSPKIKQRRKSSAGINIPCSAPNSSNLQRSSSSCSEKASKVRNWISSKKTANSEASSASLRESLLDQIRRGTVLRRAKCVADRSAPRVR